MAKSDQQRKTKAPSRLAAQAERSLREARRLRDEAGPGDSAHDAMFRMEEARALAVLDVAEALHSRE